MNRLVALVGAAGIVAITVGAALVSAPAGWIVGGVLALVTAALLYEPREAT